MPPRSPKTPDLAAFGPDEVALRAARGEVSTLIALLGAVVGDASKLHRAVDGLRDECSTLRESLEARIGDADLDIPLPRVENALSPWLAFHIGGDGVRALGRRCLGWADEGVSADASSLLQGLSASFTSLQSMLGRVRVDEAAAQKGGVTPGQFGEFSEDAASETNTATLQAANDHLSKLGGGRIALPPGSFEVRGFVQDGDVELYGPRCTLRHPDGRDGDIIRARTYQTLGTIAAGSRKLTVSSVNGVRVGALIAIRAADGISPLQNTTFQNGVDRGQTVGIKLSNSVGFHFKGYLICGQEVIQYSGIKNDELTGVTRGCFGTNVETHKEDAIVGTASRHIAIVRSVDGRVVTLDRPAAFSVKDSPVTTGILRPRITGLTLNGNRVQGGSDAARTYYPIRWGMVRSGRAEVTVVRGESAIYLGQGASDNDVSVVGHDCSIPEGSRGAVVWLFQRCERNVIRAKITENLWGGVYLDNRTVAATEWDGPCNDNLIVYPEIVVARPGDWITNSGVLIVGGNRNAVVGGEYAGMRTGFTAEVGRQHNTHDGSAPDCRDNVFLYPTIDDVYQPWVLTSPNNTVVGARWATQVSGVNEVECPILLSTSNLR